MKKIFLSILAACVLAIGVATLIVFWYVGIFVFDEVEDSRTEDEIAKAFIEEKYGMDAIFINITPDNFVDGKSYKMAFKEQEDVVFTVTYETENYATVYHDDYEIMLAEHEAKEQAEKILPLIEKIGFKKPLSGLLIQTGLENIKTENQIRWLMLETETSYESIEKNEAESIIAVLNLIKDHDIDVQKIKLYNRWDRSQIVLNLKEIEGIQSDEEIKAYIMSQ
ncbi:hypothetical protein Plano_2350 [Planococcus sp. PAMC 21323]|uniref:hypothetical protein n=1 Tax=Planococcus sp. PAMC 21323 TaxID=1526927 RepID=UPI00056EF74A|nr:hypothetical protein [Planococcus sp. PAMC 21323]AIY06315.1 hypothetical protein Plano_2350 [Planococcus sp. PAMC 21323]